MAEKFRGATFERGALPGAMTQISRQILDPIDWTVFVQNQPPLRGGAVGTWSTTPGDPFAEVMIVRDEDYSETISWLNAYFSGLAPVTQWCRILTSTQAQRIAKRHNSVGLGHKLGAWAGAVLAECSVQAGGVQNLRDVPGSAAASSATFTAGRATAVWGSDNDYVEIARRHDALTHLLREGNRPVKAEALIPVWSVLSGNIESSTRSDRQALEPFALLLSNLAKEVTMLDPAELVSRTAINARDIFDISELSGCANGPQQDRVRALDRLGELLSSGPRSPAIDALLGLGASFVDPGASVSPELLRRYGRQLPIAPIWQGVFAGAFAPLRTMTDQGGLGRLIAKSLLASDDLNNRPTCDIAFDELARWITPGRSIKIDVRSMSTRILSVEIVTGVNCAFSQGRTEAAVAGNTRSEVVRAENSDRGKSSTGRSLQEIDVLCTKLQDRIERLEARDLGQQSSLDLPETRPSNTRKSGRTYSSKSK